MFFVCSVVSRSGFQTSLVGDKEVGGQRCFQTSLVGDREVGGQPCFQTSLVGDREVGGVMFAIRTLLFDLCCFLVRLLNIILNY